MTVLNTGSALQTPIHHSGFFLNYLFSGMHQELTVMLKHQAK